VVQPGTLPMTMIFFPNALFRPSTCIRGVFSMMTARNTSRFCGSASLTKKLPLARIW
jgi:hypothetical protein